MLTLVNSFPVQLVTLCFGVIFQSGLGDASPQFYKHLNGAHSLEKSRFTADQEGIPDYLNIFKQLTDNSHQPSRNSPSLKVKFDPKSLRVSRVAEAPTRPPPLNPEEQSRLQQEYADRHLRELQRAAHLARPRPKSPPAHPSVGAFKPFPINFNKEPAVAHFSGPNFDPVHPNFGSDAEESEEELQYQRPRRPGLKKPTGFVAPKSKPYVYDERHIFSV